MSFFYDRDKFIIIVFRTYVCTPFTVYTRHFGNRHQFCRFVSLVVLCLVFLCNWSRRPLSPDLFSLFLFFCFFWYSWLGRTIVCTIPSILFRIVFWHFLEIRHFGERVRSMVAVPAGAVFFFEQGDGRARAI